MIIIVVIDCNHIKAILIKNFLHTVTKIKKNYVSKCNRDCLILCTVKKARKSGTDDEVTTISILYRWSCKVTTTDGELRKLKQGTLICRNKMHRKRIYFDIAIIFIVQITSKRIWYRRACRRSFKQLTLHKLISSLSSTAYIDEI